MKGSIAVQTPPPAPLAEPTPSAKPGERAWQTARSSPFLFAAIGCGALAAVSAAVLPTVPSYDPWAWIVWGREVVDPHLSFATGGGPSWKPLPVLFTTVYALLGGAAPMLWVITARAGGLLALTAGYRLAARLVPGPRWTRAGAGVIAAASLCLTQDWVYYMFRGTSEPMLVGACLWAIDRHMDGRHGWAFAFGVAASLIRPEAWPFVLGYAIWLWVREPRLRWLAVAGLFTIPLLWFVPPWVGSGQPFLAAAHAREYNGHLGAHPLLAVLRRGADLQGLPVLIAAIAGVALAWFRERDRLALALAGATLAWWVLVIAMTLDGYPGLERFYLPAAAVICVLAGAGIMRVARVVADAWRGHVIGKASRRDHVAVTVAVAAALIAVSIPVAIPRIDTARAQEPTADRAVTRLHQLSLAVAAVGGHRAVFPCRSSFAAVNHGVQTALAWKLHVTLGRVGTTMRHQGVMFVGPHDTIDGAPAPVNRRLRRVLLLAQVGAWRVYRTTAPRASTRCVGR